MPDKTNNCKKRKSEGELLKCNVQKLKGYLTNLEYCPKEPPICSCRTRQLAQPIMKTLQGTFDDFKSTLPKNKTRRLEEELKKMGSKNITMEELTQYMKIRSKTEVQRIAGRRRRFEEFQKTLSVIEAQCRESVMKDIVQKFAEYVAARTVNGDYPKVITEPHQRICRGLVCNMLMSLGIHSNQCKRVDTSLFEGLVNVLVDIVLKTLYQIQIIDPDEFELPVEVPEIKCTQVDCISKRAQTATRKNAKKTEAKIADELKKLDPGKFEKNKFGLSKVYEMSFT